MVGGKRGDRGPFIAAVQGKIIKFWLLILGLRPKVLIRKAVPTSRVDSSVYTSSMVCQALRKKKQRANSTPGLRLQGMTGKEEMGVEANGVEHLPLALHWLLQRTRGKSAL